MKPARPVFVLGGAHSPYLGKHHPDFIWKGHPDHGKASNPSLEDHLRIATLGALGAAGVEAKAIERGYVGNFVGECFARQAHLGALLAGLHPDLGGKPHWRVEGACASGGLALVSGIEAVARGCDFVLVAGVEVQTTVSARDGADYLARAAHYETQRRIDAFTFPCLFARRVRAYKETYGVDDHKLASAVVKAHHNAARNPRAHLHAIGARMDLETAATTSERNPFFLENPLYREHLRLFDCSPVSDGASALVLGSEAGLRELGRDPASRARIVDYGVCVEPLSDGSPDPLRLTSVEGASTEVFGSSGRKPDELQVVEVHDCFHIVEILMMEALGLAPRGGGADYVASGATANPGERPVNTGGGLLGFGHPVGATGVKQALEISRQLAGECDGYQVEPRPQLGLSANMGGDDRTAVVVLYEMEG